MTAPASTSTPQNWHSHIQGLRALAVVLVVLAHARTGLSSGFVGVDVFFVISGFVITSSISRRIETLGRFDVVDFWVRRVRRLLPALALMLVVVTLMSGLFESPFGAQQVTAKTTMATSVWFGNFALYRYTGSYFDRLASEIPVLHTWSLSVEEQFYVVFAVMLLLSCRRRWTLGATAALTTLSLGLSIWLVAKPNAVGLKTDEAAFYLAPTRVWEFGVGALLALAMGKRLPTPRIARAAAWLGIALLVTSLAVVRPTTPWPGAAAALPVAATALLIVAGLTPTPPLPLRPFLWKWVTKLGDLSYSWYLWHWPVIVLATAQWPGKRTVPLTAAVFSLPLAWIAYTTVERPLRVRLRSRAGVGLLAVVCIVTPLLLAGALLTGAQRAWGSVPVRSMAAQVTPPPVSYERGCHVPDPLDDSSRRRCSFGTAGPQILLVGDSTAAMYDRALVDAFGSRHQIRVATWSSCPLIDVVIDNGVQDPPECRRFVTGTTAWLKGDRSRSTVVLGMSGFEISNAATTLTDPVTGQTSSATDIKARIWTAGLARTVRTLTDSGHRVYVLQASPRFAAHGTGADKWWQPMNCPNWRLLRDISSCAPSTRRDNAGRADADILNAQARAISGTAAELVPVRDALCDNGICKTHDGDIWVYRDGLHVSTTGSARLAPWFARHMTGRESQVR